jgi:diacylglycerol kinase family enzyme
MLASALEQRGLDVSLFETARCGDARGEAGRCDAAIIAVVGGDGTLNEVLNGLPERCAASVAICPVGTANVVARELGMRSAPDVVADAIVAGCVRPMDIGLQGERRFLLGAGAGLDAAVTKAVQESRGRKSSLLKWALPAIRVVFAYTYPGIRVTVDGEVIAEGASYVIIGNCRFSAGVFPATPRADTADGLLDVCAFSSLSIPRLLWLVLNVWRPTFVNRHWIAYRQGREIRLDPCAGEAHAFLQIDGDPAGAIPASFSVADWQINMIVPGGRDH